VHVSRCVVSKIEVQARFNQSSVFPPQFFLVFVDMSVVRIKHQQQWDIQRQQGKGTRGDSQEHCQRVSCLLTSSVVRRHSISLL
jgi:hypothetical protein